MNVRQEKHLRLERSDALIIVDVQNDFLPGGHLAVPHGDEVIAPLNQYTRKFEAENLPVVVTRDWHPENHCSFSSHDGIWPDHCIQESNGAQLSPALHLPSTARLVSKGTRVDRDAYSAFQDTELASLLAELGIKRLFIGGLATDYCVLNTVLDALAHHFTVYLLVDAIHAVNVKPGDGDRAIEQMSAQGAQLITVDSVS